jgi:hypothetical protein
MSTMKLPDGRKVRVYRVEYNVVAYVAATGDTLGSDEPIDTTEVFIPDVADAITVDERVHVRWDYDEFKTEDDLDFAMDMLHGGIRLFIDGEESETLVSELLVETK